MSIQWTQETIMAAIAKFENVKQIRLCELVKATELTPLQVRNGCFELAQRGYLVHQLYADGTKKPGCYLLTDLGKACISNGGQIAIKSGPKAPCPDRRGKTGTLRERTWRLWRIKEHEAISINYVLSVLLDAGASTKEVQSAVNSLQRYVVHLALADYLAEIRPNTKTRPREKRYLLTKNTGPLAPILKLTTSQIYDQNTKEHYAIASLKK